MFILVKQKNDGDNFFPNQSYECHIQKLTVLVVEKRICPLDEDSGDATKHASKREPEFPSFSFRPSSCSCSWLPRALRACRRFPEIRSKADNLSFLSFFRVCHSILPPDSSCLTARSLGTGMFLALYVQDHLTTYDKDHIQAITDALINACHNKYAVSKTTTLNDDEIISTVSDLSGADGKIGMKSPRFEDRKLLPYTEAFINEIFRHTSFLPFTIPHCTTTDTTLNDSFIPRKICTFINMYQVNHDESMTSGAEKTNFSPRKRVTSIDKEIQFFMKSELFGIIPIYSDLRDF
uniref:Uncharacterized protein n=1 Tax=Rangifer tarandus platyrhynchus TaxID=3082113 RepID=A0ACB0ECR7_RANTA|nr:unnamed protein product [Rangifer tarandus platyrhynchus]